MSHPGETLRDGRYVLMGALGEGTQGATLEAVDKRAGRVVAIKRFDVRGARSWKDVELAEREARVLASLSHPQLPAYVEHFEEAGALYLVMEKVEGESLASIRARGASLDEGELLRFLRDASVILDYLHGRSPPLIHRDVKPGNVIRRPDGSFALVDFGAVRDKMRLQGGSTVVGTFGYMAPEQFQGRALPSSDVYAVGATALAMLTGAEPEDLPHKGLAVDVDTALRGRTRPDLIKVLAAMLEPDPDRRPSRLMPLVEALQMGRQMGPPGVRRREAAHREPRSSKPQLSERAARRAERRARREERRARRRARRGARSRIGNVFVAMIALTIAQMVVAIALRVVVPLVLSLLSLLFGRQLRRAAGRVDDAGRRAVAAIGRAQGHLRDRMRASLDYTTLMPPPAGEPGPRDERVRVETVTPPRVRVSGDAEHGGMPRDEHDERHEHDEDAEELDRGRHERPR